MNRNSAGGRWLAAVVLTAAFAFAAPALAKAQPADDPAAGPKKVLRYAFRIAETGFDPAQIQDLYSRTVTPHIFEALYQYDPLARPAKIRPLTAEAMPEHSDDFRVWTVKVKPGIFFADDPAFKGAKRELTAEDYVYSIKRFADPKVNSPTWTFYETLKFTGLAEARKQALESKAPFDYAAPIAGVRALDRYTIHFELDEPSPRFVANLAQGDLLGAVAREVVEFYGDQIMAHPVGTGPFRLVQWRRSSFIALERNTQYRDVRYEADPAPDDDEAQAILARMKGKRLPMLDRVEVSIIAEQQPRWLTFLNEGSDLIEELPPEFVNQAMPHGKVAPNLAKRGVQGYRMVRTDVAVTLYNMDNPILGGYTPDKIALRRAINLAIDVDREIRVARHGQAIVAQSPVMPNTDNYAPNFRSENGEYSPARAKALLDMYGYIDRNGDGWRDMPDGSALELVKATQPDQQSRQLDDEWRRNMNAIGIRIRFQTAQWPENLKNARAGTLMIWGVGSAGGGADSLSTFQRYHGKQIGGQNFARFKLPEFDAIYERLDILPDGPERNALFEQAKRLAVAYAPYKTHVHRYMNDMAHPWLVGYRRPLFWQDFWQYLDIDTGKLPAK
jgi:ABC-type transport system substrate-binding protein